jgi:CPA1 family monovalent cation:H+ antiporter
MPQQTACDHIVAANRETAALTPSGCQECLESGDSWVHLRLCLDCGHVGCCDNSKNKHATRHFQETGHAVIRSFEPGENWIWCFEDQVVIF